jgi:uncharacterized protein (TIGR02598 family)
MKVAAPVRGFSLAEIVLAMGIVSFSLIAILGLISVGLNSSKNALDESLIAAMSRQVVGNLRQQRFVNNNLFTKLAAGTVQTVFFNGSGVLVDGTAVGFDAPVYQCTVTAVSGTDRLGPPPKATVTTPCMLDIVLTFNWPLVNGKALATSRPNSYSLRTSIARYY